MKLYLAGPMRNIPHFNAPAFFAAEEQLRAQGHEVFNPARSDTDEFGDDFHARNLRGCEDEAAREFGFSLRRTLADDLEWICLHAEGIAMLPGWANSRGALAEHAVARAIGLEVIYL